MKEKREARAERKGEEKRNREGRDREIESGKTESKRGKRREKNNKLTCIYGAPLTPRSTPRCFPET